MLTRDFYELIDDELLTIIEKYKDDSFLKKQKGDKVRIIKNPMHS
jgi:hypothetical protein